MNERIKELVIGSGIYDCIMDPYDKLNNGDPNSSVMFDLERFAELIINECALVAIEHNEGVEGVHFGVGRAIKYYFGVE